MTQNATPRFSKGSIFVYVLLGLIIVSGAWLRLSTLAYQEVWYDEAYSGLLVRHNWSDMFALIRADVHPPVYYVLLKLWVSVAGPSDWALRLPSAVAGILLIPAVFWLIRIMSSNDSGRREWLALGAAYMIAINPFLIEYSQEARSYTLMALLMTVAAGWFWRALHTSLQATNRAWLWWSTCIGLAFLTHYLSAVGIIMFVGIGLWQIGRQTHNQKITWRQILWAHRWTLLPAVGCFLLWLPALREQLAVANALAWIPRTQWWFWFRSISGFLFGVDHHALSVPPVNQVSSWLSPIAWGGVVAGGLVIATAMAWYHRPKQRRGAGYLWLMWFGPILGVTLLSQLGVQWYVERYLIAYSIFFLLTLVWMLGQLHRGLLLGALLLYTIVIFTLPLRPTQRDCYKRCTYMNLAQPNERTVTNNPFDWFILRYYFPEREIKLYDLDNTNHYTTWDMVQTADILTSPTELRATDLKLFTD